MLTAWILIVSMLFSACAGGASTGATETEPLPTETEPPKPVVTADGDPGSLTCKDSYTVSPGEADGSTVVAVAGEAQLTAAQLQFLYYLAVQDHRTRAEGPMPDFSLPLDVQVCPLGSGELSWQHYFLDRALKAWNIHQGMALRTSEPQLITEEGFNPDPEKHERYLKPEMPVLEYLYQDRDHYAPNSVHQAYLDGLPGLLDEIAGRAGFSDAEDFARNVLGITAADMTGDAAVLNLGYMYFTERSYDLKFDAQTVLAHYEANPGAFPSAGSKTISFRHLLLIPENAQIAADGTVTAAEEDWELLMQETERMMVSWSQNFLTVRDSESNFARLANENSADPGSQRNGGLYVHIAKGTLMPELDAWCFDDARQHGDTGIIRTSIGVSVVYFCSETPDYLAAAEADLLRSAYESELRTALNNYPMQVDFSAVSLWADVSGEPVYTTGDILYPDVAHERFTEPPLYLQQDYPAVMYGIATVAKGGCGLAVMGSIATYMLDTVITPGMLAVPYSYYRVPDGTNGDMFRYVPAELGFYLKGQTSNYDEMVEELKAGRKVVSLQMGGCFTSVGHFIMLDSVHENGNIIIRDSNIFNYVRMSGYVDGYFTRQQILSGNQVFWIMQNKILHIPSCCRCGDPSGQGPIEKLMETDYLCQRCLDALTRRNGYVDITNAMIADTGLWH